MEVLHVIQFTDIASCGDVLSSCFHRTQHHFHHVPITKGNGHKSLESARGAVPQLFSVFIQRRPGTKHLTDYFKNSMSSVYFCNHRCYCI